MHTAKIIAICNHKGGVGKTTTAANTAAALHTKGHKVLAVDLDAQANLTYCLSGNAYDSTIADALFDGAQLPIVSTASGVDIVPAGIKLTTADISLKSREALKRAIAPATLAYDYIVIDCAPGVGVLTLNAIAAATDVVVTLTAEALPLQGMDTLTDLVESVGGNLAGYLITRYNPRRSLSTLVVDSLTKRFAGKLFGTKIRENIALAEAPLLHKDIYTYAPKSNGAADYMRFAEELITRTNK